MKESTRKALVAATLAAINQASDASITVESWKYHSERLWIAVDPKLNYIFVAQVGDEDKLFVFKHAVHHLLSPVAAKKDPSLPVGKEKPLVSEKMKKRKKLN